MGKIRNSRVTEVNFAFDLKNDFELSKLERLKQVTDGIYTLKESKLYNNRHFFLTVNHEKNIGVMNFKPSLFLKSNLNEAEHNAKVAELIFINSDIDLYSYPLFSFKYEGYEEVKNSPKEFISEIHTVKSFGFINRNEKEITFHFRGDEADYRVSFEDDKKNLVNHELYFKNPKKLLDFDLGYLDIQNIIFLDLYNHLLQGARNGINYSE